MPTSLEIGGVGYSIRWDYKEIIKIMDYLSSPDYEDDEKLEIMFRRFYVNWRDMPKKYYREALQKATEFIDMGMTKDEGGRPSVMDWNKDAPIIIPGINKVLGYEVRGKELHWWTFLSAYMEIEGGVFSTVMEIRQKKQRGKKLEKHEQEFYREHKSLCEVPKKYTREEQEERDAMLALLNGTR